jgi:alpha-L-fucosidase
MWPSTYSFGYNSMDVGPNRDIVSELERAFRLNHPSIHFGLYYCLWEFDNPIWLKDLGNNKTTRYEIGNILHTIEIFSITIILY